ncbi:L,D-transpeptidase family protein [Labilibaculum antarcticum]|uniref:Pollen allergen Poa pIX/Phl pVI n=1 Tax=Labilibaculum antarcticum TaxID=1717717 RepID=A0A1Y1CNH5_9BACT|nr:L,D-transpeptidase family protein [Labilibaculum antarcticum]BAX81915.1 Pollen allergen Poa pIX/Phl pVI [Labilibaculum antarcticum]
MSDSFKLDQKRYSRVREAYAEKEQIILDLLKTKGIETKNLQIYLRAFKLGKKIELWAKNSSDDKYQLIKEYKVCRTCGKLGPKRQQGDMQIPEGFYFIDRFNPSSNYHLSLGLNYPNKSDQILGTKGKLGGDIFIHGSCVTIGCLPITDDQIKELYLFCIEAKNSGQSKIPVHIFPTILSDKNMDVLKEKYSKDSDKLVLWNSLEKAYDLFNETKQMPEVRFLNDGTHIVE